jgi:uncharacterized protein
MESGLYVGKLRHRRFSPKPHDFAYPVFMAFLDIDRLPELMRVSPFSGYNRWNWTSYCERDHFGDAKLSLRERLRIDAERNGISLPDGPIFLLTHLRYFGYVFNPVSFYYCYDSAGKLQTMLAEVNSTFGETHNYWLDAANQRPSMTAQHYTTPKRMHVSPFMDMQMEYEWIFTEPGERLVAHMNTIADGKAFFDATLQLEKREWSRRELHRTLAAFPLMTIRVIGGIHWEALKLWAKGVPVFPHIPKGSEAKRQRTEVQTEAAVRSAATTDSVLIGDSDAKGLMAP